MFKDPTVSEFEDYLKALATEEMLDSEMEIIKGEVDLTIDVVYPDNRRRDLQNTFASVCDALNGIVYEDDSQITSISATKRIEKGNDYFALYIQEKKVQ